MINKKRLREERGSAAILEYSIILPLCFFLLVFIFMIGYVLHQRAVLESAAQRSIIITQKIYSDPNYTALVLLTESPEDLDYVGYKARKDVEIQNLTSDPYRYWNNGYKQDVIKSAIEAKVKNIINRNQLIDLSSISTYDVQIDVSDLKGIVFKSQKVVVSQEIAVPILRGFNISPTVTLKGEANVTVTQPAELIRNSHFAWDVVNDLSDNKADEILTKIQIYMEKITDFFKDKDSGGGGDDGSNNSGDSEDTDEDVEDDEDDEDEEETEETEEQNELWELPPFERGVAIEEELAKTEYADWWKCETEGGAQYEAIDFQKDNQVVSLKTIDLRTTTYENPKTAERAIKKYVTELDTKIDGTDTDRILDIRIPKGTGGNLDMDVLNSFAAEHNITLQIKEF